TAKRGHGAGTQENQGEGADELGSQRFRQSVHLSSPSLWVAPGLASPVDPYVAVTAARLNVIRYSIIWRCIQSVQEVPDDPTLPLARPFRQPRPSGRACAQGRARH